MKTSNKILLGLFLAPILCLSTISLSLYAKYKSHDYVSLESLQEDQYTNHILGNITVVKAKGLLHCNIFPSDTIRLEIEKNKEGFLKFSIQGDTLYLKGDSTMTGGRNNARNILRSPQEVRLYLPSGEKIVADYCELTITPGSDSSKAPSYNVVLNHGSNLVFDNNDYEKHRRTSI